VNGYRATQVLHAMARLEIADLLDSGPRATDDLARAAGVDCMALERLLRAAGAFELVDRGDDGRWQATPWLEPLRAGARPGLRPAALMVGEDWHWRVWAEIGETVRSGEPAFPRLYGCGWREYRLRHPSTAATFRAAIEAVLGLDTHAVLSMYDFSPFRRVLYPGFEGGAGRAPAFRRRSARGPPSPQLPRR
jgi:hypothetical protein